MKTILLAFHESEIQGGPAYKFYSYLKKKYKVYRIVHPMFPYRKQQSFIDGDKRIFRYKIPPFLQYPLEGIYAIIIWHRYFKTSKIDLAICFDSLSYFHTYLYKKLFKINKISYYNVDYSKKRFKNPFMNIIYQKITKFSYTSCDYFFSFGNKFIEEVDPDGKYRHKQFTVKSLIDLKSIKRVREKDRRLLIYAGAIDYSTTDFTPLLKALKRLKDEKVSFSLAVYGEVNTHSPIKKTIEQLSLGSVISFCGSRENQLLTEEIIPRYAIGLAAYASRLNPRSPDHAFMNKDLTGKLVDYIGAGLPIISTRINDSFKMIDENKIGFSVVSSNEWYSALKVLLTNKTLYDLYSKNAILFSKNYDTETILNPVFKKILGED